MTFMDVTANSRGLLVGGYASIAINRIFGNFGQGRGADSVEGAGYTTLPLLSPREENLRKVQDSISSISMHLPAGFVGGLNRQFANLMDDDAWEEDDELIASLSMKAFTQLLIGTGTRRRPGIGTDGRGSVTASWSVGKDRLIAECLPSGKVSMVLSRERDSGEVERAAFGPLNPKRAREVLSPFSPGVWFDV